MNRVFFILIILLLSTLVVLTLRQNKQEMNATTALAELEVKERPVRIQIVEEKTYLPSLLISGIIEPRKEIKVTAEASGQIVLIKKRDGDKVTKGELIAKVDDRLITARLNLAKANLEKSKKDVERFQKMSEGEAITPQQLEQSRLALVKAESELELLTLQISNTIIRSPITGVISKIYVNEDEFMATGKPVCEIVDIAELKLTVALTEEEIKEIFAGQVVEIIAESSQGQKIYGKVESIAVKANHVLKFNVKIGISNKDNMIKAGTLAQAKFTFKEEEGLLIKKVALVTGSSNPRVFVVNDGQVASRELQVKDLQNDQLVIASGLQPGEQVIIEGQTLVREGDRVRVVN